MIPTDEPRIFESGAWGYKDQNQPVIRGKLVNPEFVAQEYLKRSPKAGDLVLAPDHLLTDSSENKSRVDFNYHSAKSFLALAKQILPNCTPAAVVHGEHIKERVQRAQTLYAKVTEL